MFGICTSISTTSNSPSSTAATASPPSLATVTECPCFSSRRIASFWLMALSSASSTRSLGATRAASGGSAAAARRSTGRPRDRAMASSRADCLTGFSR